MSRSSPISYGFGRQNRGTITKDASPWQEMLHIGNTPAFPTNYHSAIARISRYQDRANMNGSMTFHRGQGGNLAIKDADEFVNSLLAVKADGKSLQEAVDGYDKGALLRGEEVEISQKASMAFLDYENFDKSPVFKMGISPAMKF